MSYDNVQLCVDFDVCGVIKGWDLNSVTVTAAQSPYEAQNTDVIIFVDASGGPVTVQLHRCDCKQRPSYIIRKIDASANPVTVQAQAGSTVQGAPAYTLTRWGQTQWLSYDIGQLDWKSITNLPEDVAAARGDLITRTAAGVVALPAGLDGQVLAADSTAPSGLRYVNSGGAGEINTGANVGAGAGKPFKAKAGTVLQFRSIAAGRGVDVATAGDDVVVAQQLLAEAIATSAPASPNPAVDLTEASINTTTGAGGAVVAVAMGAPPAPALGQRKIITATAVTGLDRLRVNVAPFASGTAVQFAAAGDTAEFVWTSAGWALVAAAGAQLIGGPAAARVVAYPIAAIGVDASTTAFTTVGYFPFLLARHYAYTGAACLFNATVTGGLAGTIRVQDTTHAVTLGTAAVAATGAAQFALASLPFANATLEIQIRKHARGGVSPRFLGIVLEFDT